MLLHLQTFNQSHSLSIFTSVIEVKCIEIRVNSINSFHPSFTRNNDVKFNDYKINGYNYINHLYNYDKYHIHHTSILLLFKRKVIFPNYFEFQGYFSKKGSKLNKKKKSFQKLEVFLI